MPLGPYQSLPSVSLCRVQVFAECHILPSATLGKASLCRVPEIWHSAKIFALGKSRVSRSDVSHIDGNIYTDTKCNDENINDH